MEFINPPVYHTNFLNCTKDVFEFLRKTGAKGLGVNLDTGAMIENQEDASVIRPDIRLISHVHISEPGLKPVVTRKLYEELADLLRAEAYDGFVSIEMRKGAGLFQIEKTMEYAGNLFG